MKKDIFADKVIAITGGASGIGAAIGRRFGRAGSRIAVLDMNQGEIDNVLQEFATAGIEAIGLRCDVTSRDECEGAVAEVIRRYGGLDVLVNNAGITQRSPFVETDVSVYRRVMDVNFFGALYCAKAAIKSLIARKGMIIVTSSHAGYSPLLGRTGYSASKHALHGLFESLRTEVRDLGVHVMMVCPGFTKTALQSRALDSDGSVTKHPQSTYGSVDTPDHVAEAVYRGAGRRKKIIVLTLVGRITYYLHRISPGWYEKMMADKMKSELIR